MENFNMQVIKKISLVVLFLIPMIMLLLPDFLVQRHLQSYGEFTSESFHSVVLLLQGLFTLVGLVLLTVILLFTVFKKIT